MANDVMPVLGRGKAAAWEVFKSVEEVVKEPMNVRLLFGCTVLPALTLASET